MITVILSYLKDWGTIFKSWGPIAIGLAVAYVAYRQWITTREKLRLDLFEKRYRIYEAASHLLAVFTAKGRLEQSDVDAFWTVACESRFLFPTDEIFEWLKDIRGKAFQLQTSHADAKKEILEIKNWLGNCKKELPDRFVRHLRICKWGV